MHTKRKRDSEATLNARAIEEGGLGGNQGRTSKRRKTDRELILGFFLVTACAAAVGTLRSFGMLAVAFALSLAILLAVVLQRLYPPKN